MQQPCSLLNGCHHPAPFSLQVNYFAFVAEEVRIGLASLGLRSLDELVGRADLLKQSVTKLPKTEGLDLSFLTTLPARVDLATSGGARRLVMSAVLAIPCWCQTCVSLSHQGWAAVLQQQVQMQFKDTEPAQAACSGR